MPPAAQPYNELERLEFLRSLTVLDTAPERCFDNITALAATILECPIVLISLVDQERQFFKSRIGLNICETSRDVSFCSHAILNPSDILIVEDALFDERFCDNQLVESGPLIRFYAGAPLVTESGLAIGTLCAIDTQRRKLTTNQIECLKILALQTTELLLTRKRQLQLEELVSNHSLESPLSERETGTGEDGFILSTITEYGVIRLDCHGKIISWNTGAQKIKGYTKDEVIGRNFTLFYSVEDALSGKPEQILQLATENGTYREVGKRVKKDGSFFWAEVVITATFDRQKKLTGFTKVTRDVSESKALQDQKEEQEKALKIALSDIKLYKQALDANAIVAVTDAAGRILDVNDNFIAISGYSAEELLGQNHRIINSGHHPKEFFIKLWRTISRGEMWKGEICNRKKTGEIYWVETTIVPLVNEAGRVEKHVAIRYDITQKKKTEQELSITKQRLEYTIEAIDSGIVTYDRDEKLITCNSKYRELYNLDNTICKIGQSYREILTGFFNKYPEFLNGQDLNSALEERLAIHRECRAEWIQSLGELSIRVTNKRLRDGSIVSLRTDITDLIKAQKFHADAKELALAASRSKSEFLAHMSHEIRTPLSTIIGATDILLNWQESEIAEQNGLLATINSSSEMLLTIINDVLDFSKIEAGMLSLERTSFSLREAIEDILEVTSTRAAAKKIELFCEVPSKIKDNRIGDSVRFKQVLLNFVSNAIKFTETGSVSIEVQADYEESGAKLIKTSVRDTGIGLTSEQIGKLFKSFSQADISTTRISGGSGLGLAISSKLSSLMGGTVGIESRPGSGSTFWFSIPLEETSQSSSIPERYLTLSAVKLLLIDLDSSFSERISRTLAGCEIRIKTVSDLEQLSAELANADYQFTMISCNALKTFNQELIDKLKVVEQHSKIILLSNGTKIVDSFDLKFAGTLQPPFRLRQVAGLILQLLKTDKQESRPPTSSLSIKRDTPLSVLLAEDNLVNQQLVSKILSKMGCLVSVAHNGQEALQKVLENSFDLILMDCNMPILSGIEATKIIRGADFKIPIIAFTADALESTANECLLAGMNCVITKPFKAAQLKEELLRVLQDKSL